MRAVTLHAFGDRPRIDDVAPPRPPQAGELAIEVSAVGVGAWDNGVVAGRLQRFVDQDLPVILGAELAGRISEVGAGVDGFAVEDRVMSNPGIVGAWAERVTVAASSCGHAPETNDDAHAAALPVGGLAAWQALDLLALPAGASVLVLGAGGSVGSAALQLARVRGLRPLAVTSAGELESAKQFGADALCDYRVDWVEELRDSSGSRVDGVIDLVGGDTLCRSAALVRSGGRIVTSLSEAADTRMPRGITVELVRMQSDTATLDAIAHLVDRGDLTIPVGSTYSLDEVGSALDDVESRRRTGKAVIIF
jgi:NADPH:quinone reductase-like Zn-dependent oxidoreductase